MSHALDPFLSDAVQTASQRAQLAERIAKDPAAARELTLAAFARAFVRARVMAREEARPPPLELPELDRRMQGVFALIFPNDGSDLEYALAANVLGLLRLERAFASPAGPTEAQRAQWGKMSAALMSVPQVYRAMLAGSELDGLRSLLALIARWLYARAKYTHAFDAWATLDAQPSDALDALVDVWLERS
jgi:hypothetical protein